MQSFWGRPQRAKARLESWALLEQNSLSRWRLVERHSIVEQPLHGRPGHLRRSRGQPGCFPGDWRCAGAVDDGVYLGSGSGVVGTVGGSLKVAAIDALAELRAQDAHLKALAIALETAAFAAIAALVVLLLFVSVGGTRLPLDFRLKACGLRSTDCFNRNPLLFRELTIVLAIAAVTVRSAGQDS